MATALLLLRHLAQRSHGARGLPRILSHNSARVADEAAAGLARGYRAVAREVEGLEGGRWRLTEFFSRRGLSVKSGVEGGEEKAVELVSEKGEKVRKVGRPRKVEDGGAKEKEKVKPRRKPRATMKKLEEEIAANEAAASGSGIAPVKLKLTTRKRRTTAASVSVAGADSGEAVGSSLDDFSLGVGVAPQLGEGAGKSGREEEFRSRIASASTGGESGALNSKAGGESSNSILSSLVEDGEEGEARSGFPSLKGAMQSGTRRETGDAPPRTAPRFPKLDLTSKQRITRVELDGDEKGNEKGAKVVVPDQYSDPKKVFQMLQHARPGTFTSAEKARLSWIFHRFAESGWVSDQALALYINSKFFPTAVSRFRKFFSSRATPELRGLLIQMGPSNSALKFLFPIFSEFCIAEFSAEINRYRELVSTADLTKPDAWYPFARAIKRKVIYHQGPTNSGKTYMALKRFMEASNGIYCSPLRLLAMEVFDKVNAEGIYCNLHTGQEKKDLPFANHLACTVEMAYLSKQWEVAVIDEVQMMSDEYRGWAWTRAFLGLQADEIHVCGDPSAVPLLRSLCASTGDELIENEYERFKPLRLDHNSLNGDFSNIEAGDCIVAFSRKDIFDVKREVELATNHKCCVVYGALPPETRTQQAKLFNDQNSGYDVLVASDAVGMGLNLNIRRVVFYSLDKFDGDAKRPIPAPQVKQIAGRAGRRGSIFPDGVTTAFYSQDIPYLEKSLQQDVEPATAAGLFPVYEQVELFASQLPETSFAQLLERFAETCRLDGAYFLCRYDNLKRVASVLDKVKGLSLEDRFNFCFTPVNVRDPQSLGALYRYALAFSQKIPVVVQMGAPLNSARDEFELMDLETRHQVLSMYLWLSQHFPEELFVQKDRAAEMATTIATLLGQSLVQSAGRWHGRGRKPGPKKTGGRFITAKPGLRPKVVKPSYKHVNVNDRQPKSIPAVC
ncbi:hypothetical protein KC19_3G204900 [Ceratodon purpureus]|uniref:RNA helicase n=1 Tax=Ceratodon purpureus TaxID=3225 RepID=A0A8T0IKN5_CERPU|nr:hypothetical protein KC19_3G204900 [Ceratodon purpureus]